MPIINRSYYDAAEKGRQDASTAAHNALAQQQGERVNALMQDPNATPEAYTRAGRSDIANSLTNIDSTRQNADQESHKRLFIAAQYALNSPDPKAFISQNFPELAKANPTFETDTPEQIGASLQQLLGVHGANAGIAPTPAPRKWEEIQGPRGSIIQRDPVTGEQKQVIGPDNSQPGGGGAPAGYRYRKDGNLEPIPGGPADPSVTPKTNPTRVFQQADKLRDEFNAASKDFVSVGDNYNNVRAAAKDPSAAGDISMIFAYMKMLDPNSVVREQEYATAQNAAGIPERVQNSYNAALNGQRLNPTQRADFIAQAEKVYKVRKQRNQGVVDRYTKIAERFGVNPQDVVGDLGVYEDPAPAPAAAPAAGQWSIRPVGK